MPKPMKLMSPTGHLGFTPIEQESFWKGVEQKPDYIIADSGSSVSARTRWELTNRAAPPHGKKRSGIDVPCIETAECPHDRRFLASDTGTNRGVDQYADYIKKLARDMGIRELTIAKIYSEVDKQQLKLKMDQVQVIGLDGRENHR